MTTTIIDQQTIDHASIVARAIHTLEYLRDYDIIENDDSLPALFVRQSWSDLRRLLAHYTALGILPEDIEP